MNMAISKLTSKNQATVPKIVRDALCLELKDSIVYEILEDNTVLIRRALPIDKAYLKGLNKTLTEWESDEDEEAYKNL